MARIGDIMIDEGLVCPEDVDQVLAIQKKSENSQDPQNPQDRLFGKVLCDLNLVTPMDNYCVLDKHKKVVSVKAFLLGKNIITRSRLEKIEASSAEKDIPIISCLLEEGVVSKPQLQQILFELFHIPFRSVSDIVFNEKNCKELSRVIDLTRSARHKVIPLQLTGNTLVVGITDPVNLVFLRDLDQIFPQYRFTPIFITFSGFTWFFKMLYKKNWVSSGSIKDSGDEDTAAIPLGSMDFSVLVADPDQDKDAINALYEQYEQIRREHWGTQTRDRERAILFFEFIRRHHGGIAARFNCSSIRFSFKKSGSRLVVTAMPGKEIG